MLSETMKLIIFDFDGTIGDTKAKIVNVMHATMDELKLPKRSAEECASTIGFLLHDCFKKLYPGMTDEEAAICTRTYRSIFLGNFDKMIPSPFPGVIETLEDIASRGIQMSIASSRSSKSIWRFLGPMGIEKHFKFLIGGEQVENPKPASEPALKILEHFGIAGEDTLVVGDMPVDIMMGKAAGCKTCAVTYGNAKKDALERANPDFIVDNFNDILACAT